MTSEEVYKKALLYFSGDDLATKVWVDKYCLKDLDGNLLESSPVETLDRVASELISVEHSYPNPVPAPFIKRSIQDRDLVVAGSGMYGIGNNYSYSSLGNCFVIGNGSDSYGGIMMSDQEQVQLMKRRGGVGHDLSHLRYKGA